MQLHALLSFTFLCVFSVLCRGGYGEVNLDTLELVQMMYRHGDRSPIEIYPTDPHNNTKELWPNGLGQLTKRGKIMQYKLGQWLRKRYKNFTSERWLPEEVYVRSTDVDRTLMSAACNLAAFYFPEDPDRFENALAWMPTPIHTAQLSDDRLLNVEKTCPRIEKEIERQNNLPIVRNVTQQSQELFKFLTEQSGKNITTVTEVDYLYDTLKIESMYNLTLPDWTDDVLAAMKELSNFSFEILALSEELKRLRAGPIIGELGKNMQEKATGKAPDRKMFMYSAHDTTLSQLLLGLKVFNGVAPPYAATFIVEMHNVNGERFVQMFLRNDTEIVAPPYELFLPGCSELCPLEDWLKITSNVVPEDWEAECHEDESFFGMADGTIAAIAVACILAILLLVLLTYNFLQWRRSKEQFSYQAVPNNYA